MQRTVQCKCGREFSGATPQEAMGQLEQHIRSEHLHTRNNPDKTMGPLQKTIANIVHGAQSEL